MSVRESARKLVARWSARGAPWWLVVIGVLPAVLAIGIFVFVARFSMAHDESRCPFHEVESRALTPTLHVREDARRCLPEIEEHRWSVVREGHDPLELGRFPLEAEQVDRGFPWLATLEDDRAVVTVTNEGRGELVFREPPQDEPPQGEPSQDEPPHDEPSQDESR